MQNYYSLYLLGYVFLFFIYGDITWKVYGGYMPHEGLSYATYLHIHQLSRKRRRKTEIIQNLKNVLQKIHIIQWKHCESSMMCQEFLLQATYNISWKVLLHQHLWAKNYVMRGLCQQVHYEQARILYALTLFRVFFSNRYGILKIITSICLFSFIHS